MQRQVGGDASIRQLSAPAGACLQYGRDASQRETRISLLDDGGAGPAVLEDLAEYQAAGASRDGWLLYVQEPVVERGRACGTTWRGARPRG